MTKKLIYLAGALFSEGERRDNLELTAHLERWFDVFLPQRDGRLIGALIRGGMAVDCAYAHVFEKDIDAISRCDALMINLDGRVVDEGAAFELGYAFAHRKVCVGYRTDIRVLLPYGLNPMIVAPLETVVTSKMELDRWCEYFASKSIEKRAINLPTAISA